MLEEILGLSRVELYAEPDRPVPSSDAQRFSRAVQRRADGEPLQYVLGSQEFRGLVFTVRPGVLIPRPETELLVEEAVLHAGSYPHPLILDVGTGSGCLAVSLAHELPTATVLATDRSPCAIAVARENAVRHGVAPRVKFSVGDLVTHLSSDGLTGKVAVLVANLPYIREDEWKALPRDVREFEPKLALDGGPDGLLYHRRLLQDAQRMMKAGGVVILEVGVGQARLLCEERPWSEAYRLHRIRIDGQGVERMVCLERQG